MTLTEIQKFEIIVKTAREYGQKKERLRILMLLRNMLPMDSYELTTPLFSPNDIIKLIERISSDE